MKKILTVVGCIFLLMGIVNTASAYISVKGYYRSDGTYVAPHVRSNPNGLKYDNYSWTPSQGLYNSSYGTRGSAWDTPTWITDPDYYVGKSLYESGSSNSSGYSSGNYSANNKVTAPSNATVYGSDWYCNTGYKTVYSGGVKTSCSKVTAPSNATVYGSDWYCNTGYKTKYDNYYNKVGCILE